MIQASASSEDIRFRALVETAVDGVIVIDARGLVQMFNPACERLFGYSAGEVVGKNVKMLMPQPFKGGHDSYLRNYRDGGERKIIGIGREVVGQRKDKSVFPMDLSVGEWKEEERIFFVGIIRDLTDRKQAESAVLESERSFRLLVENVTDYALFMLDPGGCVASWNIGARRIKQYEAEEIQGRDFAIFYPDEDRAAGEPEKALEEARAHGKHESEGWRVRKDGSRFWASVVIDPVRNESGAVVGFVKITRDITERKSTQEALLESAKRLTAVVDTAVDGVILIDSKGAVLMFNPACERLFGYRAEDVVGKNVKMLMPEPFHSGHDHYLENYHNTGTRKIIGVGREVVGRRRDGTTFPMDLSVGEWSEGSEVFFAGVIHDLSDRKRTEAQLTQAQKMETVGQLSGGIAHDFNNLLTVIVGNAETLSEKLRARPDLKQLCDGIFSAGQRGAELTRHLLAFSRRQVLQPVAIDCNHLLTDMQRLLQRTLREDIEIKLELIPVLLRALADPAQLESAVINLSLNAQDAMPEGGALTFATSVAPLDERYRDLNPEVPPGEYVLISITDEGMGMAPDVLARAFEPFFTTKDVGKGSGLGLSMVYGFVKQSGGHVAIYSELGLGTTVRLYLPVAGGKSDATHSETEISSETLDFTGSETILVVEDDPFVRGYAVAALESLGYRVITAANGREALAHLSEKKEIELLFTDIVMPGGVNGWDLAKQARDAIPTLKVLFTSGYPLDSLLSKGRIAPGETLLMKPYRKNELASRVRQVLSAPSFDKGD